jgi:hypothetical protein
MPLPVVVILVLFGLLVLYFIFDVVRAGPNQLSEMDLARATVIQQSTADHPEPGWSGLGQKTTADGLNLKFDHDDDPWAQASYLPRGGRDTARSTTANRKTVRLRRDLETHHVHTRGYVFRVRMRGTEPVIGKAIKVQMHVRGDGTPHCGRVENDDDTDPAVGGWIEFESVELLEVKRR